MHCAQFLIFSDIVILNDRTTQKVPGEVVIAKFVNIFNSVV